MEIRTIKTEELIKAKAISEGNISALDENSSDRDIALYEWDLKFHYLDAVDPDIMVGAYDNGYLIGISYILEVRGEKHLSEIIIHPDYRGKRGERSVGKQLFETMMAVIDTLSPKNNTHLDVARDNPHAKTMYEEFSYVTDTAESQDRYFRMTRKSFGNVIAHNHDHAEAQELPAVQPTHLSGQSPL